ncbi:acetylornithine deacetylase/succinyl-diaminopimelate desuccinylase family protein [Rhizobiaceae bacterium]|nr:acetylornithine deacetylase/succinyl-diaminopimelate desuccinylase family protein [Rhizobiaceae bacterium]
MTERLSPDLVRRTVEGRTSELVALTQDLVRIPTVNPPGDAYADCAEYLARYLNRAGFTVQRFRAEGTPGDSERYPRINIVARREGARPGPTVHFNGHIDVVAAGHGWTFDPFGAELVEGRIYGRGTCDMKGGLAAAIIASQAYIALRPDHDGAIEISGTVDEESGGFGGVAHLASLGLFSKPRVDHVIIPEPLNKDRICLGHRGVWWANIETFGRQAHGSMPFLGDCAVRHMGAVLQRFERDLFPALDARHTAMPVVPEGARSSTLNINAIHGGAPADADGFDGLPAPNVPDRCEITIDRRFLIEEDIGTVKGEVRALLEGLKEERAGFDYAVADLMEVLPTMTDAHAPVVRAVENAVQDVLGRPAEHVVSPGTYDQKHIARIGHLHDCIAYGPGILDLAHQPDEFIVVEDMVESARVMCHALDTLLHPTNL